MWLDPYQRVLFVEKEALSVFITHSICYFGESLTQNASPTSAHAPAAPLGDGVPALAGRAAVGRPRVGAVAEPPVHALGRAGGPRRPLGPSSRGSWKRIAFHRRTTC